MKLLLDQNISFRVVKKLKSHFSIVEGVRECGLYNKDDRTIWEFCRQHGYTIITFDEDRYNLTTLYGPPPKIIWLKTGNLSNDQIVEVLVRFKVTIDYFSSTDESCLAIYQNSTVNL